MENETLRFSPKKQKLISVSGVHHCQCVGGAVLPHLHPDPPETRHQLRQQIPPQSAHGLAAQGELPSVKIVLRP